MGTAEIREYRQKGFYVKTVIHAGKPCENKDRKDVMDVKDEPAGKGFYCPFGPLGPLV